MTWLQLIGFLGASVLLTIAPGPDNLLVISLGISHGRREAVVTALGMTSGLLIHTVAATSGIATVLRHAPLLFILIQYSGACYLLYCAWQIFHHASQPIRTVDTPSTHSLFRRGLLMNLLNPKVTMFFLAFLPQFIPSGTASPFQFTLLLGLLFYLQAVGIFTGLAWTASSIGALLQRPGGALCWLSRLTGLVLVILAARLLISPL